MLEILNRYSHGLASIPTIHALRERGCLDYLEESATFSLEQLTREFCANRGYLEVALRMLVCLDWVRPTQAGHYAITREMANFRVIPEQIMALYRFPFDQYVQGSVVDSLEPWLESSEKRWNSDHPYLPDFLDGLLVVPLLLALKTQGRLCVSGGDGHVGTTLQLDADPAVRREVERLFVAKGWAEDSARELRLNGAGRYVVDRILITAALASYRPMFLRAEELLFGDATRVFALDPAGHETHLERTLNVLGSGFQHEKYFTALSEIVVRLFDNDAYSAQPKYIADMGCGDGSLLRKLYEAVRDRTRRGRVLDRHPLIPIAVDYNDKALQAAARTLQGIEHVTLKGDIGDPLGLLRDLRALGIEDVDRVLHVRSFLDHDRPYREPEDRAMAERRSRFTYSGIYVDSRGHAIPPGEMVQSTVEHLRRWSHLVNEHGLLMLEVHCLPAGVTTRFLDESESFHFDAYQSLSHQFLMEAEVFLTCAAEAGLFCRKGHGLSFPRNMPFTRISLNHFEKRPYTIRHAQPEDLPALPGRGRDTAAQYFETGVREFPEGQFVLESAGRILAAVCCRREAGPEQRGEVVRVVSGSLLAGEERSHAGELLEFVRQYWTLRSRDIHLAGIDELSAEIAEGTAEPSLARSVALDLAARVAGYPFDAQDDPRAAESELGRFSFRWLLAILQRMGAMREPGESHDLDELKGRLGVAPKYDRYFDALIRRLEIEGLVILNGRRMETTELAGDYALRGEEEAAAFKASFHERFPACSGLLNLTACCLGRYEEIITGRIDIADVLFPDGNMDVFAEVFRGDAVSDYFNRIVADAVLGTVTRVLGTERAKLRILEIGAGTGGTTAAVLAALQSVADRVEFCFSDVSPAFLRHARRRFSAQYPWLDYRTLNIEEDLSRQGFEPHGFDVVVAANVLHDTKDIEFTLEQTRGLLKPGGLLILNEYTSVKDCLSFSGALLHGWWLFEDPERRLRDSCLLSVPQWQKVLEHTGFAVLGSFALPTQSLDSQCGQSVMLCASVRDEGKRALAQPARAGMAERRGKHALVGEHIEQDILTILGEERSSGYSAQRPLMEMGLDSIELVELKSLVGRRFGIKLSPAFLFEHETQERMAVALAAMIPDERLWELEVQDASRGHAGALARELPDVSIAAREAVEDAIAIVGVACRFPGGAASPEAFWRLLERGDNAITSMPSGRWRWPAFVDVDGEHRGIDRGGFLERIDEFDALFFRISPKEAELMDPQQRLLLELSWEAMEDGGYRPSALSGRKIGVFVGACHADYRDLLTALSDSADAYAYIGSGSAYSILANRLSYFYDFKGPSLTIDTACSSSLFALHEAVNAMRRGDCEQALVGAVNLLCNPTNSVSYHQAGMLSPNGQCRTFDETADGYVRGEGGAMLLLKPLATAIEHGDAIYGLIKSTAVNHGGQAASLTAPKPEAQAAVVEAAWEQAAVPPESVGYIETHGTGTRLGDPIEVSGLMEAFRRLYRTRESGWPAEPHIGIGSVKSNVGHLEGAAGLAGLIKVLMSIEHGRIPRTLNFQRLNPDIDLAGSPFYVVERNVAWPCFRNEKGQEMPRRAGVSAFGFGGANAHVVIEEYRRPGTRVAVIAAQGGCLIPLSARSEKGLTAQARRLLDFVARLDGGPAVDSAPDRILDDLRGTLRGRFGLGEECTPELEWTELGWGVVETRLFLAALEEEHGFRLHSLSLIECPSLQSLAERIARNRGEMPRSAVGDAGEEICLEDVAYTLQVGRKPMEERLAFVVDNREDLVSALRRYVAGDRGIPGCFRGSSLQPTSGKTSDFEASLARRDLPALASLWVGGTEVDWARLYPATQPRRVHLPTYPFTRQRYWVAEARDRRGTPVSHALLNQGEPEILGYRFSTLLTGEEFFLADHVIQGRRILPAVAYLEMARAAVERVSGLSLPEGGDRRRGQIWLKSFAWVRPLSVDRDPVRVNLRLISEGGGELGLEIYSGAQEGAGDVIFHGQGRAGVGPPAAAPVVDVGRILALCTKARYSAAECYQGFGAMGYEYGPRQRAIETLYVGVDEIVAKLTLPASLSDTREEFVLHPTMADSAVQAALGFSLADRRSASDAEPPALPFELQSVEVLGACTASMWALVRRGGDRQAGAFDIDLCDEDGRLIVRFRGWTTLPSHGDAQGEMILTPVWEPVQIDRVASDSTAAGRIAIIGGTEHEREILAELRPQSRPLILEPTDSIDQMRQKIASWGDVQHILWIVPDDRLDSMSDDALLAVQHRGVLFGFRLIKAMLGEGYGDRRLTWSVITSGTQAVHAHDHASPAHASVHGLIGSMAKEYADWNVRLMDLPSAGDRPWRDLLTLAGDPHGNAWVYRDDLWYRQQLVPCRPVVEAAEVYRPGGVYVVIGGAGGVGQAWSEALLRRTQAQLVWIGRRPQDGAVQAGLDRLAHLGPAPRYIAADARDREQLARAREAIKREYGRIDGVIHAAMVLQDRSLANMTEDEFSAGLASKVDVCVRLAQVFAEEPLEFVLFFSSVSSFFKWPGQSSYVAGCSFEDAFANRLATEWPCRVRVVNWGYWGGVGAAAPERYRSIMARKGLGPIEAPGAMQALDLLLGGPVRQLAYLKVTDAEALAGAHIQYEDRAPGSRRGTLAPDPDQTASGVAEVMGKPRDIVIEHLLAHLRLRVAETLGMDPASLDSRYRPFAGALLGEFGMDSISSNSLRNTLRRELGVDIPVQWLIGERAQSIAGALYEQMLLQQISGEPRLEGGEETETFVF
jgi:acyl transferase domain-containing protein/SAM-dependent methyltransferase/acyl carrier protein